MVLFFCWDENRHWNRIKDSFFFTFFFVCQNEQMQNRFSNFEFDIRVWRTHVCMHMCSSTRFCYLFTFLFFFLFEKNILFFFYFVNTLTEWVCFNVFIHSFVCHKNKKKEMKKIKVLCSLLLTIRVFLCWFWTHTHTKKKTCDQHFRLLHLKKLNMLWLWESQRSSNWNAQRYSFCFIFFSLRFFSQLFFFYISFRCWIAWRNRIKREKLPVLHPFPWKDHQLRE